MRKAIASLYIDPRDIGIKAVNLLKSTFLGCQVGTGDGRMTFPIKMNVHECKADQRDFYERSYSATPAVFGFKEADFKRKICLLNHFIFMTFDKNIEQICVWKVGRMTCKYQVSKNEFVLFGFEIPYIQFCFNSSVLTFN